MFLISSALSIHLKLVNCNMLVPCVEKLASRMKENCQIEQKIERDSLLDDKYNRKLYKLLAELLETEKKYVLDMEEICDVYLPLTEHSGESYSKSLDRAKEKLKRQRSLSRPKSFHTIIRHRSFKGADPPQVVAELEYDRQWIHNVHKLISP